MNMVPEFMISRDTGQSCYFQSMRPPTIIDQGSLDKHLTLNIVQIHTPNHGKPPDTMSNEEFQLALPQHNHAPASSSPFCNFNGALKSEIVYDQNYYPEMFQQEEQEYDEKQFLPELELVQHQQQQQHQDMTLSGSDLPVFGNVNVGREYCENNQVGMPVLPMAMRMPTSSDSLLAVEVKQPNEIIEMSIERRKKRMMKNRESAARSRARKQYYINSLEENVRRSRDTLKRLIKEQVFLGDPVSARRSIYDVRRTNSARF